jgi:hypothetical protein
MATGTVQARGREEFEGIAGMKNPWLRLTGGFPTRPLPRGVSDLRTLSQIQRKTHAPKFNSTTNGGLLEVVLTFRRTSKTRTYFEGVKSPVLLLAPAQVSVKK